MAAKISRPSTASARLWALASQPMRINAGLVKRKMRAMSASKRSLRTRTVAPARKICPFAREKIGRT